MKKTTNCPNCGAVINPEKDKCEYCGTSYYDLSCIPINEPFYLRLNVGTRENPKIICQKVFMPNLNITHYTNDIDVMYDNYQSRFITNKSYNPIIYELTFHSLEPQKIES